MSRRYWASVNSLFVAERLGSNDPATLSAVKDLGVLLDFHGQYESAANLFRYVVDRSIATLGRWHESTIAVMEKLAMTTSSFGKREEAQALATDIFQIPKEQFVEHAQMSNRVIVRRIKVWYELCFKYKMAADKFASKENTQTRYGETESALSKPGESIELLPRPNERSVLNTTDVKCNRSPVVSAGLPYASVWELRVHLIMRIDELEYCTKAEFYGWEEKPEEPLPNFKEKFRVEQSYFGSVHDGIYRLRRVKALYQGELILERILVPSEDIIVALALGEELSGYEQTSNPEDEDGQHSGTIASATQQASVQIPDSGLRALNIRTEIPPYQPLAVSTFPT
ncbi:hypothetical protein MMC13_001202 [Lambiella insularis]|nr:hypothetical protein [Lambiella insularis]